MDLDIQRTHICYISKSSLRIKRRRPVPVNLIFSHSLNIFLRKAATSERKKRTIATTRNLQHGNLLEKVEKKKVEQALENSRYNERENHGAEKSSYIDINLNAAIQLLRRDDVDW